MTPFDRAEDAHHLDELAERSAFALELATRASLLHFCELVATWGARTDLVAARDPQALVEVLCLDAMILAGGIADDHRVVDVGAGAGAPSIPLALLRPDLRFTLVEPRRKRVAFMRTAVGALGIGNRVAIREGRIEDLEDQSFDTALSRATFEPNEWLQRGRRIADHVAVLLGAGDSPSGSVHWEKKYETAKGGSRRVLVFSGL